jgi:hypothetical protein
MWRRPKLVGGGLVRRAESRWWFRVAVRFGSPWRHPFLRTGDYGIRLFAELLLVQITHRRPSPAIVAYPGPLTGPRYWRNPLNGKQSRRTATSRPVKMRCQGSMT